jgi:hypothetical protein
MARTINGAAAAVSATISVGAQDVASAHVGLTLTFADGRTLTLRGSDLSPELRVAAMLHGLKQKLVDAAAISRDPLTGKPATISTKYDAVFEIYNRFMTGGTWNKVRGEGGGTTGSGGLLYRALVRLYDGVQTPEQVRKYLDGLNGEQQAALRGNKKVAPVILAIKAEDAARRAETGEEEDESDNLLAGLGDLPE